MSWREDQKAARESTKPQRVNPLEYDDHDREWMKKSTFFNRKLRRNWWHDHRLARKMKKDGLRHTVNDYTEQREDRKIPAGLSNHRRMLMRRERDLV